jgi:uncharacterized protein (TIGR02118 family)
MIARFMALYETPADLTAFDRHYRDVHIPLARRLPGLRCCTLGRDLVAVRGGEPYYLVAELEWATTEELRAAFASPDGRATAADAAHLQELASVRSVIYRADESVLQTHLPRTRSEETRLAEASAPSLRRRLLARASQTDRLPTSGERCANRQRGNGPPPKSGTRAWPIDCSRSRPTPTTERKKATAAHGEFQWAAVSHRLPSPEWTGAGPPRGSGAA